MTVGNRGTGKLQATTLLSQETGLSPLWNWVLLATAYVLNMCKMATVQIFLERSNRDVHVGVGFVHNRT